MSDKAYRSEESVSFVRVRFVKGYDRDNCLPRMKGVVIPPILRVAVYTLTDPSIRIFASQIQFKIQNLHIIDSFLLLPSLGFMTPNRLSSSVKSYSGGAQ